MFFLSDSHGLTFLAQSLQHPWPKGGVGDLGPSAVILGKFTHLPYFVASKDALNCLKIIRVV